jgi:CRP-like cAMP-binding protein
MQVKGGQMNNHQERTLDCVSVFGALDVAERAKIQSLCRWRKCKSGESIFEAGSPSDEVFFICDGAVNIVDFSPAGREVTFATLHTGELFGELAAIDGRPRSAGVVAAGDCLLATLSSKHFLDLLRQNAGFSFALLERLAHMVRTGDVRVMELSTLGAAKRIYAELLRMAEPDAATPGLWIIRPLPPLREIGSRVGTTRETVARTLSQLYPSGLIRRKGRNLYLMDRAKFEQALKVE